MTAHVRVRRKKASRETSQRNEPSRVGKTNMRRTSPHRLLIQQKMLRRGAKRVHVLVIALRREGEAVRITRQWLARLPFDALLRCVARRCNLRRHTDPRTNPEITSH